LPVANVTGTVQFTVRTATNGAQRVYRAVLVP